MYYVLNQEKKTNSAISSVVASLFIGIKLFLKFIFFDGNFKCNFVSVAPTLTVLIKTLFFTQLLNSLGKNSNKCLDNEYGKFLLPPPNFTPIEPRFTILPHFFYSFAYP